MGVTDTLWDSSFHKVEVDWGKELCIEKARINDQLLFTPFPTWFYETSTFEAQPFTCALNQEPEVIEKLPQIEENIEQTWALDFTEKQMRKQARGHEI